MKMFQLQDNGFVPTTTMVSARDQFFLGQPSKQMTSSGGSISMIDPNSLPSSSNSSSASGVHPPALFLPMNGHPSMMPYMRPLYHAPMAYDTGAPQYFATLVPVPMDTGCLSEYINPRYPHRIVQAQLAHQYPISRSSASSYKTVMCQSWLETAHCKFGDECKFAHGEYELRESIPPIRNPKKYKTRLCEKYTVRGCCPYGNRCLFIHPEPSQMMGVPPPAGVGMTLDTYKNYVVVPQPSLMLASSDETSDESRQFHFRMVEAPTNETKDVCMVSNPDEPLPPSRHLSVHSADGAVSTKDSVQDLMAKLATMMVLDEDEGKQQQQPKQCKQVLRDMLRRENQQRMEAKDKKIETIDVSPPTEEEEESISDSKKSSQTQQQNVSFNESGQTEMLTYILSNVLDSFP